MTERNLALPTPSTPLRVALITSDGSDAYHDAVNTLSESGYALNLHVFDVRVQGPDLERTVISALKHVASRARDFDLCVITRGGGSRVELSSWDNLAVARAVATCPVKVLVGIGHEQDRSALDELALSQKTPTAAAQWIVHQLDTATVSLQDRSDRLRRLAEAQLADSRATLLRRGQRMLNAATRAMRLTRQEIEARLPARLDAITRARLRREAQDLRSLAAALSAPQIERRVASHSADLQRLTESLVRHSHDLIARSRSHLSAETRHLEGITLRRLRDTSKDLEHLASGVTLRDPRRVLERGFALVRDTSGKIITSQAHLASGDTVQLELADGTTAATIGDKP